MEQPLSNGIGVHRIHRSLALFWRRLLLTTVLIVSVVTNLHFISDFFADIIDGIRWLYMRYCVRWRRTKWQQRMRKWVLRNVESIIIGTKMPGSIKIISKYFRIIFTIIIFLIIIRKFDCINIYNNIKIHIYKYIFTHLSTKWYIILIKNLK